MSDTQATTQEAAMQPLWDDERIENAITCLEYEQGEEGDEIEVCDPDEACRLCKEIRDNYEAALATVIAERDALAGELAYALNELVGLCKAAGLPVGGALVRLVQLTGRNDGDE